MTSSDLFKQLLGGAEAGGRQSPQGNDLLDRFLGSGAAGGLLSGALAGGLTSLLMGKGGRKLAKNALKLGGVAAIGGLAYAAYSRYRAQSGQDPLPPVSPTRSMDPSLAPPPDSGFLPDPGDAQGRNALGVALIRAMIAAAKADGHIDAREHRRIFEQLDKLDLGTDEKAFLLEELERPLDIDAIARLGVSPQIGTEIYAASLLAVDVDSPAERAYLQMLAARLGLDPALVEQIHASVESASSDAQA